MFLLKINLMVILTINHNIGYESAFRNSKDDNDKKRPCAGIFGPAD